MNGFELNKIAGAVLLAGLVAMLTAFAAEKMVVPTELEKPAYVVEVADAGAAADAAAPAGPEPIEALIATADIAKGEVLAKACAACHGFDKGGPNKVGPNLWGIMGNIHAHLGDAFAYSTAMKALSDKKWDYEAMNAFLYKPRVAIPGTKMGYAGMAKTQDRANLIAWMRTKADSPVPLPK